MSCVMHCSQRSPTWEFPLPQRHHLVVAIANAPRCSCCSFGICLPTPVRALHAFSTAASQNKYCPPRQAAPPYLHPHQCCHVTHSTRPLCSAASFGHDDVIAVQSRSVYSTTKFLHTCLSLDEVNVYGFFLGGGESMSVKRDYWYPEDLTQQKKPEDDKRLTFDDVFFVTQKKTRRQMCFGAQRKREMKVKAVLVYLCRCNDPSFRFPSTGGGGDLRNIRNIRCTLEVCLFGCPQLLSTPNS